MEFAAACGVSPWSVFLFLGASQGVPSAPPPVCGCFAEGGMPRCCNERIAAADGLAARWRPSYALFFFFSFCFPFFLCRFLRFGSARSFHPRRRDGSQRKQLDDGLILARRTRRQFSRFRGIKEEKRKNAAHVGSAERGSDVASGRLIMLCAVATSVFDSEGRKQLPGPKRNYAA